MALRRIHVGVSRTVDDGVDPGFPHERADSLRVRDVEPAGGQVHARPAEPAEQRRRFPGDVVDIGENETVPGSRSIRCDKAQLIAQLTVGSCDEDIHISMQKQKGCP